MITIKSAKQVEKMRASAKVTKGALELLEKHIKPGVTTAQLDKIAYDFIISQGAKPNFLNYNGFPEQFVRQSMTRLFTEFQVREPF